MHHPSRLALAFCLAAAAAAASACGGVPFTTAELFAEPEASLDAGAPEGAPGDAPFSGERTDADAGDGFDASTPETGSTDGAPVESSMEAGDGDGDADGGSEPDGDPEGGPEASPGDASDASDGGGCDAATGTSTLCGYDVTPPAEYVIDFGVYPGTCTYAHHTHPIVMAAPAACCGDYSCACLETQGVCDQPAAPEGALTVWEGCGVGDPATGMLVVTCQ